MTALRSSPPETSSAVTRQLLCWIDGLQAEVSFWDQWFRSKGGEWPHDYEERLSKDRPLPSYLHDVVAHYERTAPVQILDVGSGPLSSVGTNRDRSVQVRAVDPLAGAYASFIKRERLAPPVWPEVAFAEDLSAFFPCDAFDIVHCRNALDHSFDPLRGLWEMIAVLRIDGQVVLWHEVNVAEKEHYGGLHQWNFDIKDGRPVLWNNEHCHDLPKLLGSHCTVSGERLNGAVLIVIRKDQPLGIVNDAYRSARIRDLLTAFSEVALLGPLRATMARRLGRRIARLAPWSKAG